MKMARPCREWHDTFCCVGIRHPTRPKILAITNRVRSFCLARGALILPRRAWLEKILERPRSAYVRVCAMCRFLDAGMPRRSTRLGGRRSKSAKARNRGKGYVLRCGVRYRELSSARNFGFEAGRFSPAASLECVYNFGVMARGLLNGDLRFRPTRDFKDLGVAKRPHSTTSTR